MDGKALPGRATFGNMTYINPVFHGNNAQKCNCFQQSRQLKLLWRSAASGIRFPDLFRFRPARLSGPWSDDFPGKNTFRYHFWVSPNRFNVTEVVGAPIQASRNGFQAEILAKKWEVVIGVVQATFTCQSGSLPRLSVNFSRNITQGSLNCHWWPSPSVAVSIKLTALFMYSHRRECFPHSHGDLFIMQYMHILTLPWELEIRTAGLLKIEVIWGSPRRHDLASSCQSARLVWMNEQRGWTKLRNERITSHRLQLTSSSEFYVLFHCFLLY